MRKVTTRLSSNLRDFVVVPEWLRIDADTRRRGRALEELALAHPLPVF